MAFFCYICEEESTHICARCTKDACDNHLCERCHRCSDCCECEVRLDQHPAHPAALAPEIFHPAAEAVEPAAPEAVAPEWPPVKPAPEPAPVDSAAAEPEFPPADPL